VKWLWPNFMILLLQLRVETEKTPENIRIICVLAEIWNRDSYKLEELPLKETSLLRLSYPEDGGGICLRNVGELLSEYTAPRPSRLLISVLQLLPCSGKMVYAVGCQQTAVEVETPCRDFKRISVAVTFHLPNNNIVLMVEGKSPYFVVSVVPETLLV
jgi:hypothetical protein